MVGGEPDPAYIVQFNVGSAMFSGAGFVLAVAAVYLGAKSIDGAKSSPPGQAGQTAAMVRGSIGVCLGILLAVCSPIAPSYGERLLCLSRGLGRVLPRDAWHAPLVGVR